MLWLPLDRGEFSGTHLRTIFLFSSSWTLLCHAPCENEDIGRPASSWRVICRVSEEARGTKFPSRRAACRPQLSCFLVYSVLGWVPNSGQISHFPRLLLSDMLSGIKG